MSKAKAKAKAQAIAETSPDKATELVETEQAIEAAKEDAPKIAGIAVCGSHPQTILQAPFDDPNWLIYACSPHNLDPSPESKAGQNPGLRYLNGGKRINGGQYRVDQWFEVHRELAHQTRPYSYLRELESLDWVWMRDPEGFPRVQGAKPFPEEEMKQEFCPFQFTSSISFMLAKAIYDCCTQKIPRIGIWGVMQASENEYVYQRPGIQYFIWEATRRNIEVIAPRESKLFDLPAEIF